MKVVARFEWQQRMVVRYVTRFQLSLYWQAVDIPLKPTFELRHATLWKHLSAAQIYLLSKRVVAHCNTNSNGTIYQTEFCYAVLCVYFLDSFQLKHRHSVCNRDNKTSPQIFKHCKVSTNGTRKFYRAKNFNSTIRLSIKKHYLSLHVKW